MIVPESIKSRSPAGSSQDSGVINAILITFAAGFVAVIILMVLGTPLAYVLTGKITLERE